MIKGEIKTKVAINYFNGPVKIEKNFTGEDINERYVYLIIHKSKSYILKGFKIHLEHLDPNNTRSIDLFKESIDDINEVYQEYFFSKAACLLNSHIAKPLSIDKVIEVANDDRTDSYMYIEIIFEYGGVSLQSLRPTDLELTYNLMQQSADALLGLHDLGIVHFDIKPLNMVYDNDKDLLKLIDLGSAFGSNSRTKLMGTTESLDGKMRSGTFAYCPPEALKLASGVQMDPNLRVSLGAVDVYSWAMCFYSLLLNRKDEDLKSEYKKFKFGSEVDYKGFIERLNSGFASLKPKNDKESKIKDNIKEILIKALNYKPKERPVMKRVVEQLKNLNKIEVKQVSIESKENKVEIKGHKGILEYVKNYVFPNKAVYTGNPHTNQKVNLKMVRSMEKAHKYGLMVPNTKVNGRMIGQMERESSGI